MRNDYRINCRQFGVAPHILEVTHFEGTNRDANDAAALEWFYMVSDDPINRLNGLELERVDGPAQFTLLRSNGRQVNDHD